MRFRRALDSLPIRLAGLLLLAALTSPAEANYRGAVRDLDPNAPRLEPNATPDQRLLHALRTLAWARDNHPPGNAIERPGSTLQAERHLRIAMRRLSEIPMSDVQRAADDQRKARTLYGMKVAKTLLTGKAAAKTVMEALGPTTLADDVIVARNALMGTIRNQLMGYTAVRVMNERLDPKAVRPPDPVIKSEFRGLTEDELDDAQPEAIEGEAILDELTREEGEIERRRAQRRAEYDAKRPAMAIELAKAQRDIARIRAGRGPRPQGSGPPGGEGFPDRSPPTRDGSSAPASRWHPPMKPQPPEPPSPPRWPGPQPTVPMSPRS